MKLRHFFALTVCFLVPPALSQAQGTLSFSDITTSAGTGGPVGSGNTGGHAAVWADVDGDGLPDLYITMLFDDPMSDLFFRNLGGNQFADEATARNIDDADGGSHGATFADLDNDGDLDLVNGTTGLLGTNPVPEHNNIYRNDGSGVFTDVTSGTDITDPKLPTRGVVAFDMDGDGDLDLLAITNFEGSDDPSGERNELYRNNGGLDFTRITSGAVHSAPAGQGATDTDFDNDGDIDIIAGNRTGDLNILRNNGSGAFTMVDPGAIGISHRGREGATMGDVNNDGWLDILLSDFNNSGNFEIEHLYVNDGDGTFTFRQTFTHTEGYMGAFGDLDNDGDLDIVFAGDDECYLNDGSGNFSAGPAVPSTGISDPRAISFADIDNDGDLDFAFADKRARNRLMRNNLDSGNWLKLNLISPQGQAGAFGAKVRIYPTGDLGGNLLAFREARSSNGYLGENSQVVHVGLGANSEVDVEVLFLDGSVSVRSGVAANQTITVDGALSGSEPVITSFSPLFGPVATEVTLTGGNFAGATSLDFNGTPTTFTIDSDTQIRADVPAGAATGRIRATSPAGIGLSASDFTVTDGSTLTLTPTDDGQVKISSPGTNYGGKSTMKLGSGIFNSYVKFNVTGLSGAVAQAVVRLQVASGEFDGGDRGGSIHLVSNNFDGTSIEWNEGQLNAGNAPVIEDNALDELAEVLTNEVVDFDVTPAVTANGVLSFAIKGLSGNQVKYYTKEGIAPPQLIITPGSGGATNIPPVAINDAATTPAGTPVVIDVAANDTDANGTIDLTTVTVGAAAAHGVTDVNGSTGEVTYQPDSGFTGTDQFGYTVDDDAGDTSNEATVTITVTGNSGGSTFTFAPSDDGQVKLTETGKNYGSKSSAKIESGKFASYFKFDASTVSGTITSVKLRLAVSTNSSDGGDHGGEIYLVSNDFKGTTSPWNEGSLNAGNAPEILGSSLAVVAAVTPGQVVEVSLPGALSQPGVVSFGISNPLTDLVKYYTSEGTTPPQLIVTTGSGQGNQPPVAQDDQISTPEGISTVIQVLANDSDADGTIDPGSVTITNQPAHGSTLVNPLSGLVTYQPDPGFSGRDLFNYTVDDNDGASSSAATVTVTVTTGENNQPPVATHDEATTLQGNPVVIDVLNNDTDADGSLVASSVTLVSVADNGTTTVNSTSGAITYTPSAAFTGNDGFSYTVADDDGAVSNSAAVQVTVTPNSGSGQTLTFNPTHDGQVKLTEPDKNYGSKSTTKIEAGKFRSYFKFAISGISGIVQTATLRLQVTPDNSDGGQHGGDIFKTSNDFKDSGTPWTQDILTSGNAPVPQGSALDGVAEVAPSQFVDFDVTADVSGNGAHSFVIVNNTGNQVKYFTREGTFPPQLIVTTGDGGPANEAPVAVADAGTTDEDQAIILPLLANDSDSDGTLDPATVTIETSPQNGNVTINSGSGQANYTPNTNFFGTDAFSYTVRDDDGDLSNTADVSITVQSVNDAPSAADDATQVSPGVAAVIAVTENDADVDGSIDPTTVTVVDLPSAGSTSVNPFSGLVTYTPGSSFSGTDTFTYTVDDNLGLTSNLAIVSLSEENTGGGSTTFTFEATEDNQVKLTEPNNNYGAKGSMKIEAGKFESYLKFDVAGLNGAVTSVKLRLYVGDASSDGGTLYRVSNNYTGTSTPWDDDILTANNAPQVVSGPLADLGQVILGEIIEITVPGAVTVDGVYSFVIKDGSSNQAKYATHETPGEAPELVVVTNGSPPATPQVTSFTPASGQVGQEVTVVGQNFQGTSTVEFGGVQSSFVVDSDTQIRATVPSGAVTGKIKVTNFGVSGESSTAFTVEQPPVTGDMEIVINADDEFDLYVNGVFAGSNAEWNIAKNYTAPLRSGDNVIAVLGKNDGGSAGLIAEVRVDGQVVMVSDGGWRLALSETPGWQDVTFDDSGWGNADDLGKYGAAPWNKNIQSFPNTSDAHWIWDNGIPDRVYLRGSFRMGPPQVTSFSPANGLVGTEVTITGSGFSSGATDTPGPIQILPLGNSITRGVTGSTDNAGWRNDLAELLDNAGINYDFVGSLQHGTGFDNEHEGHNGYWADEVLAELAGWLNSNPPDMVLFHIGTNDISSSQSNSSTVSEIGQNLDVIRDFDPNIITILAGIIPRTDNKDATTTDLVGRIEGLVTQRQAAGERVFYVDMNGAFKASSSWATDYYPSGDSVHPNDTGYGVMAGVWLGGIMDALTQSSDITVAFNGIASSQVLIDSDSQLRAVVPAGATSGPIAVTGSSGSGLSALDFTVTSSTVAALEFTGLPSSGWASGSTHALTWNTLGNVDQVRLEYSTDGGTSWKALVERVQNKGHFPWTTPESPTRDLVVRISDAEHGEQHGVSEMKLNIAAAVRPEFANLDEIRQALFAKRDEHALASRADLDNSGAVDVVDFVNLLDLDNRGLRKLGAGQETGQKQDGDLAVEVVAAKPASGLLEIPVKFKSDTPIRAFQLAIGFNPDVLEFNSPLPARNDFGMRLEFFVSDGIIKVIGYLEKENGAIDATGDILSLRAKIVGNPEQAPEVRLQEALFVSRERLAFGSGSVIRTEPVRLPTEFALSQNYPNPFNPSTNIHFSLPQRSNVEVKVFNLRGELVKTLISEEREPGRHQLVWSGSNDSGVPVASGIYIYRIKAGKWKDAKRMTLVK